MITGINLQICACELAHVSISHEDILRIKFTQMVNALLNGMPAPDVNKDMMLKITIEQ